MAVAELQILRNFACKNLVYLNKNLCYQTPRPDSIVLEIEESDLVSDQSQIAHRFTLDVTGYAVQFKLPEQEWDTARQMDFERSNIRDR